MAINVYDTTYQLIPYYMAPAGWAGRSADLATPTFQFGTMGDEVRYPLGERYAAQRAAMEKALSSYNIGWPVVLAPVLPKEEPVVKLEPDEQPESDGDVTVVGTTPEPIPIPSVAHDLEYAIRQVWGRESLVESWQEVNLRKPLR